MKIYKIAVELVRGDPNDTNVQIQNQYNAQTALEALNALISNTVSSINVNVNELEQAVGIPNNQLNDQVNELVAQALMQSPEFQLLQSLGLVTDPRDLADGSQMSRLRTHIQSNIVNIQQSTNEQ